MNECALDKSGAASCGHKAKHTQWHVQKRGKTPFVACEAKAMESNWNNKPVKATQIEKAVIEKHSIRVCFVPALLLQNLSDHRPWLNYKHKPI